MRKWKNAYINLSLSPAATGDEIRSREKAIADSGDEAALIAKTARENLTQDIKNIMPSFFGAIPGLSSPESDIKTLRKRNRARKELTDEILSDAFAQMGLSFVQQEISMDDVDMTVVQNIGKAIDIRNHSTDLKKTVQAETDSSQKQQLNTTVGAPLFPPHLIVEDN
jgi:hypothetical protein